MTTTPVMVVRNNSAIVDQDWAMRDGWISNTAHTEADTLDPIIAKQQDIIKRFGLDFAQLVAREDENRDQARERFELP